MTDRELLELAAKAAGYNVRWHDIWQCFVHAKPFNTDNPPTPAGQRLIWVPLEDDGDALRLAVELRIQLDISASGCIVYRRSGAEPVADCRFAETRDIHAATRLAITRAAAEIGRGWNDQD